MLNVEIEVLYIRRAHLGIDGEEIALRTVAGVHGRLGIEGRTADRSGRQRVWPKARISRTRAEYTVPRQVPEKHVLRECVVEQSPSAANHGLTFTRQIVGKSNTRGKVVVVLPVELIGLNIVPSAPVRRRIEGVEHVRLFAGHTEVVPANAVIQSQLRCCTK